jgi:nicotinamidase-related amidase
MSLTTLDQRTALLVVDLQEGVISLPTVHPAMDVVDRAASLAAAFRAHGLPVVLINVADGAPATDGMTDLDAEAHHNSIGRIFPKLGETGTTAAILTLLERTR